MTRAQHLKCPRRWLFFRQHKWGEWTRAWLPVAWQEFSIYSDGSAPTLTRNGPGRRSFTETRWCEVCDTQQCRWAKEAR